MEKIELKDDMHTRETKVWEKIVPIFEKILNELIELKIEFELKKKKKADVPKEVQTQMRKELEQFFKDILSEVHYVHVPLILYDNRLFVRDYIHTIVNQISETIKDNRKPPMPEFYTFEKWNAERKANKNTTKELEIQTPEQFSFDNFQKTQYYIKPNNLISVLQAQSPQNQPMFQLQEYGVNQLNQISQNQNFQQYQSPQNQYSSNQFLNFQQQTLRDQQMQYNEQMHFHLKSLQNDGQKRQDIQDIWNATQAPQSQEQITLSPFFQYLTKLNGDQLVKLKEEIQEKQDQYLEQYNRQQKPGENEGVKIEEEEKNHDSNAQLMKQTSEAQCEDYMKTFALHYKPYKIQTHQLDGDNFPIPKSKNQSHVTKQIKKEKEKEKDNYQPL